MITMKFINAATIALEAQVVEVGGLRPPLLRESAATHIGVGRRRSAARDLAPEPDVVRVISQGREHALVTHEQIRRIVAHPSSLARQPPVVLEQLIFQRDLALLTADGAVGHEGRSRENNVVVLDPAVDIRVVSALVVRILVISVGRVINEEVRNPIAGDFVVFLPARLDRLHAGQIVV